MTIKDEKRKMKYHCRWRIPCSRIAWTRIAWALRRARNQSVIINPVPDRPPRCTYRKLLPCRSRATSRQSTCAHLDDDVYHSSADNHDYSTPDHRIHQNHTTHRHPREYHNNQQPKDECSYRIRNYHHNYYRNPAAADYHNYRNRAEWRSYRNCAQPTADYQDARGTDPKATLADLQAQAATADYGNYADYGNNA